MALTLDSPAMLIDMAELGGAGTQLHWSVVREMWSGGETFALRLDGQLIGLFGLYPVGTGAEAWMNVAPAAAKHMRAIIGMIRLTLASRSYPEIVVLCTSEAGRRIARLAGFRFAQSHDRGEIWHGKFAGRGQGIRACQAAGRTAAAPDAGRPGAPAGGD